MKMFNAKLLWCAIALAGALATYVYAQQGATANQDSGPRITVAGRTYTQRELLQRNAGTPQDQDTQFPPHKIIGNIYYVGTGTLSSFLVVTPQGNILIDSTFERDVPVIQKSVEQLGFKFSDTKILLGSHAHNDHMEGDALVKQLTGAQVMAMAEDIPALQDMKPGGKPHPIDKVLHDGDTVTLGGTTLVAHLTPGHTRGTTTWTMKAQDGGKTYDVVIIGSLNVNPGYKLVNNTDDPQIVQEYTRAFQVSRGLPCDVPLGSHPGMYNMKEKYAKLRTGGPNPFIDPAGYKAELDIDEAMFHAILDQQQKAVGAGAMSSSAVAPSATPSAATPAPAAEDPLVAQGRARYQAYRCQDCHGQHGEGTDDAPDLIGTRLNAQQIAAFLNKPSADAAVKGMPDIPPTSPDLQPLVAYVLSLKASKAQ